MTPVSYFDNKGRFQGITLAFMNPTKLSELYEEIENQYSPDANVMLSAHCFVGEEMFYGLDETYSISEWTTYAEPVESTIHGNTTCEIEIDFDGLIDANFDYDLEFENPSLEYPIGSGTYLGDVQIYSVTKLSKTKYRLIVYDIDSNIVATQFATPALDFGVTVNYKTSSGAQASADYVLSEPNYNKDAIEVPVFEYSLQIGDTKSVEIGDNILENSEGIVTLYTCVIRNANTVTQLNVNKYFEDLTISVEDNPDDPIYNKIMTIGADKSATISFEENNTIMRIKIYDGINAIFNVISAGFISQFQGVEQSETQIVKSALKNKDIVIYKQTITEVQYRNNASTYSADKDLLFIIHNPQDINFDGDDLLVNINHYRLK